MTNKGPSFGTRIIIYTILGFLFILAGYFIAINAMGYQVYIKNGKITKEKTGTIIIASRPGDAKVYLDGISQKNNTPGIPFLSLQLKRLKSGYHNIKIEKEGYETWEGKFKVEPGMVSWGVQILLIPLKKSFQEYNLAFSPYKITRSQDKEKVLLSMYDEKNLNSIFWELDTTNKKGQKLFEKILKPGETLSPVAYSEGNSRILFEETFNNEKNYFVYEAKQNPKMWNLSVFPEKNYRKLVFNPKNHDEIFALIEDKLFLINYVENKMSGQLESKLADAYIDNRQFYILINNKDSKSLYQYQPPSVKKEIIKLLPKSENLVIQFAGERNGYVVLAKDTKILYLIKPEQNGESKIKKISENVDYMILSPANQFLSYYTNGSFYSYEIEKDRTYTTLSNVKADYIEWLNDQFNLIYNLGNKTYMVTYFGDYNKELFQNKEELISFVSPNSPRVYFFAENTKTNLIDLNVFDF